MDTARASKLAVGLAALMLVAVMAALTAARGNLGFADWPAVSNAPIPEETVVILDDDSPLPAPVESAQTPVAAEPVPSSPAQPSVPVTRVDKAEAAPEPSAEPVEEDPAVKAGIDREQKREESAPAEAAPDVHAAPAAEPRRPREGFDLARPGLGVAPGPAPGEPIAPEPADGGQIGGENSAGE